MRFDDIQAFDDGGPAGDNAPMQFDDIEPEEDQNGPVQFNQIQPAEPGQPQGPQGPQPGPIGAAIAGAAPAAAPITAAIGAGTWAAGAAAPLVGPITEGLGLAAGSIAAPWITIPAALGAGLIASGVVGKIQDWLRDNYGPSTGPLSKPYEAAAAEQQPIAYNIGRVAPIAAGMTTGNVSPLVRAASAGLLGSVDVVQQGIEKGFGNIDPTEALVQAGAGAILPRAREWAGGARPYMATKAPAVGEEGVTPSGTTAAPVPKTSAQDNETPVGKPAAPEALAEQQAQGQKSAPFNTSPSVATSFEQPRVPGASDKFDPAATTDARFGATVRGDGSEQEYGKSGVGLGAAAPRVDGAPTTVVDTAPIPADIASAIGPEPQAPRAPAPSSLPAENATAALPQPPQPAAAPVANPTAQQIPSAPPIEPNVQPPIPTERPTPAQEATPVAPESQARPVTGHPDIDNVVKAATAAAAKRVVVDDGPMPSIANSSKADLNDLTAGQVVIDRQVAQDHPEFVPSLAVHETVEGALKALGASDDVSHRIATGAERADVERRGLNWDEYSQYFKDISPQVEAQKVMPDAWDKYNLHIDPYDAIGHHTNKDIMGEFNAAEATPPGGEEPDLTTPIPDFLRAQPPAAQEAIATSTGRPKPASLGVEAEKPPQPASLGAAATPGQRATLTSKLKGAWDDIKNSPVWFENPIRKIFSPQSVSEKAETAAAASRDVHGMAMAFDAQNVARLQNFRDLVNQAPAKDVWDILLNFEKGTISAGNPLSVVLPDVKWVTDRVMNKIKEWPEGDQVSFIEKYFPRSKLYAQDEANQTTLRNYLSQQGSTGPLKARKFPTIQESLDAGVKLNPDMLRPDGAPDMVKILGTYLREMSTYGESQDMLKAYVSNDSPYGGIARVLDFTKEGDRIMPGEVPLEGRTYRGLPVFAPQDVATIWNNFWDPGVHGGAGYGDLYDAWMHGKTVMNAATLLGGGYHISAIGIETGIMNFSTGLEKMARGDIAGGLKTIGKSPGAPILNYMLGKKAAATAIDPTLHPELAGPISALQHSGFTFSPHQLLLQNPDLQATSPYGNFFGGFSKANIRMEADYAKQRILNAADKNMSGNIGAAGLQVGREAFGIVGKAMQAAMYPIFQHYIPLVKNGTAIEKMAAWMEANPKLATFDANGIPSQEMIAAGRKIADMTDNALGMIHQSNVFWNKLLKQAMQATMLSWGWNFGTVRSIGGGALKALRSPGSISPTSADWDPRVSYVIAMPILTTVMAGIYQLFKTGQMPAEPPHGVGQAFTAATGGKAGGSNEPERAILPGYQKDILGAWNNIFNPQGTGKISSEVYNKLAPAVRLGFETMTNEDWAGHPIWNPNHPMTQKIKEYFQHVGQSLMPIAAQQITQAQAGTHIGPAERLLGVRPAPSWVQKPAATGEFMRAKNERDWQAKQKLDKRMGR